MKSLAVALLLATFLRPDGHHVTVDPDLPDYSPAPPMIGELHIVGSNTMRDCVPLWVEIFQRAHPAVRVHTALYGSGTAPAALMDGAAQVGPMGREMLDAEVHLYRNKVKKPVAVPGAGGSYATKGATHGIVIWVNKDNPIAGLSLDQLDAIFSKTRNRGYKEDITTWGQVGLTDEWADEPINLYGLQPPNGIATFFTLRVMAGGDFKETLHQQVSNNNLNAMDKIIRSVAADKYGIGYAGFPYGGPGGRVIALAAAEGEPFFEPSLENVISRDYPLSRYIYVFVTREPGQPIDPFAKEFLRVVLSKQGQEAVARTVYLPLPANVVKEWLAVIE